ncbi:MAG TPA: hypothetical protein VN282_07115 [Pyrinomonadaceae bacterium]|jgi:hypothetical protein|nr:hypothetical protein [Pyrinomonadaceae bacterium]
MPIDTSGMDPKQASMVRAQEELADKNFATQMALLGLQQKIHEQQQEAMTLSNIEKSKDEAMKAVIQNIK